MKAFLLFHLFAILCTLALFIRGFFPVKNVSHGFATEKVRLIKTNAGDFSNGSDSTTTLTSYRRLVLMVIDALRADFAFGPFNYLPKTYETIRSGHGLQFIAKTQPPTVTLPRIKAITTGSTPSFVDVVLNFESPALEEDNIVTQMKRSGRKIVFFGDDTWIRLFPQHFERSDGTTSFYVSDYTEVDANVTRHLKYELSNPTWDVMILHYLGLDHIGHLAGPSSPLVKPKLKEMDNVIRQIYNAMEQWDEPSLLVVCGDHGMSDQGGHGGASPGEIKVPVLLLSPQIVNRDSKHVESISQEDLCPTLSVLLGLPIPKNNVGRVVTRALTGYTLPQKVYVIHQNAVQAMQILKSYIQDLEKESSHLLYSEAKHRFHKWLSARNSTPMSAWEDEGHVLLTMYSDSLTLLAEKVMRLSTQYDVYAMAVSVALLWMLLASLLLNHLKKSLTAPSVSVSRYARHLIVAISTAVLSHITMCTGSVPSDLLCQDTLMSIGIQLFAGVVFVICLLIILTEGPKCMSLTKHCQEWLANTSFVEAFLLVGTVAHTFTLFSSSFVEEEHQTFYFLTTSVHLLLLAQAVILLLEGRRDKCHQNSTRNAAKINYKKYGEITNCGEKFDNSIGEGEVDMKTVQSAKSRNIQHSPLSQSGDFSCTNTMELKHSSGSLSKDKELANTLHAAVPAGGSAKLKKANIKDNGGCISLIEFMHVSASIVCVLVLLRVLRRWNQTGNKWLDVPDFGDWLTLPQNKMYLSLVVVFSLMIIGASQGRHLKRVQSMSTNLALTTVYLYRVAMGNLFFPSSRFLSPRGIMEARASFFFIGLTLIMSILPTNCFRLEPAPSKQELQKSLPAIKENSQIKKTGYLPILDHSKTSLHNHSGERNLAIGQMSKHGRSLHELNQTASSETPKHKMTHPVGRSKRNLSPSSSQILEEKEETIFSKHQRMRGVASAFLCFMCLVMRPHNMAVVALMSLVEQMMTPVLISSRMKPTYILLYCLWMGQAFFFFLGNSNSLSTLDLTTGYTGLYDFVPAVTGTLLCLATYAGTIFWILTFLRIVCLKCDTDNKSSEHRLSAILTRSCCTLLLSRALPVSVYTVLVATQRYHLFVWTVFSPKLLYEGANTFVIYALAFLLLVYSLFES